MSKTEGKVSHRSGLHSAGSCEEIRSCWELGTQNREPGNWQSRPQYAFTVAVGNAS